jgi:hypothetical protein
MDWGTLPNPTSAARKNPVDRQPRVGRMSEGEKNMSTTTVLIIVVVLLLLFGGGFGYRRMRR